MISTSTYQVETGTDELLCHIRQRVAVITLNRPKARNALSDHLTPALRRMVRHCSESADVRAVLITGSGSSFCAGGDVKGMGARSEGDQLNFGQKLARLIERQRTLTGALFAMRKPTVAALPGPAAGAGLSLALACDIRIAAASAFVSTAYAKIGLSGDYGIAWLLSRTIGPARARELMLLSDKIGAERCETIGLFNRVVPDDVLQEEAFSIASRLAEGPATAFGLMKDNLDEVHTLSFTASLDKEAERMILSSQTEEHREAVSAFIGKRPPSFH
ncbi:enoyl-CoA hydratase [Tardiphaga sp. 804_B3_N1_9]|uniref:enoyl-CoA hydratase n=1 Tax=Tardiphaga sp. 804_B3_N1_9 TaxID=3240786 RepID=UPI003F25A728